MNPLAGIRVLDLSALGPGPFCSMLLADHGADVIAVDRPTASMALDPSGFFARGKRSIVVDIRRAEGAELIMRIVDHCDVLIESNRPGTLERLGLGPELLLARNPRLVYTRLTGWGQVGPFAARAGHDINYLAIGGALDLIGSDRPVPPLNLVGDFAAGSLTAAMGIAMALVGRASSGRGTVIDAAMVDGAALLISSQMSEAAAGWWSGRGTGLLSGAAPFYGVYECADGGWFAVGAIEPKFYDNFLAALGLDDVPREDQLRREAWPDLRDRVAQAFAERPRDHWVDVFGQADACGDPVLTLEELDSHPHLKDRATVVRGRENRLHASPAPRFGGAVAPVRPAPERRGEHTDEVLVEHGFAEAEIALLHRGGVIA